MRVRPIVPILVVAAGLTACSDNGATSDADAGAPETAAPAASAAGEIVVESFAFPASISVSPGATVEVVNDDGAPHTVVAAAGEFSTDVVDPGGTASLVAPTAPGTYDYACSIHPSMTAQLVVEG